MSNMTHTPGPWRFELETKTIRNEPNNYWLASIDSWDGAVNHAANARLIAAAPELLEALCDIVTAFDLGSAAPTALATNAASAAWLSSAKAAITKATGQ